MGKPWAELPPINGSCACLTCGCGAHEELEMERIIKVGFGDAWYSMDGKKVTTEHELDDGGYVVGDADDVSVADVERMAAANPDHDWRIYFDAPLYSAEYQRHRNGAWVLVKKGMGFA